VEKLKGQRELYCCVSCGLDLFIFIVIFIILRLCSWWIRQISEPSYVEQFSFVEWTLACAICLITDGYMWMLCYMWSVTNIAWMLC